MSTTESAVQRCLDAYNQADAREDARNDFSPDALARVNRAWRRAMPILTPDTLDAFIACLTHGLLYEVFPLAEASKLLYAAQVTLGLLRARREAARQEPKSQPKPAPTPTPVEGGEAAVGRTAGAPTPLPPNHGDPSHPQPSRAPSMGTVSLSPWVGDHEPQPSDPGATAPPAPPTPLPLPSMAAKPQLAAPQVPQPAAPQVPRNQVDELLEQLYAGKLPPEHAPAQFDPAVRKAPAQAPPPPSLHNGTHALTR